MTDNELYRTLGRLESKLDAIDEKIDANVGRVSKLEQRANKSDQRFWYASGVVAGAAGLISWIANHLPKFAG